jgi:hypothetical protein
MPRTPFPVIEAGIALVVGAADGVAASSDTKNYRVSLGQRRSTWVEGGALALGLVGWLMDQPGWGDPLIISSATLIGRQAGFRATYPSVALITSTPSPTPSTAPSIPAGALGYRASVAPRMAPYRQSSRVTVAG